MTPAPRRITLLSKELRREALQAARNADGEKRVRYESIAALAYVAIKLQSGAML